MKTNTDTADFCEALLFAFPEHDNGENEIEGKTIFDFSAAFETAIDSFISGFREYLSDSDIEIPDSHRSFGGNVFYGLSGHGCGFWDSSDTEHLQAHLEAYSGNKYRLEHMDICEDESGKLDIAILPEFIADYRKKMFAVESEVTK